MNNRRNSAVAAKKRRRTIKFGKRTEEIRRETVAAIRRNLIGHGAYAFGGTKSPAMGNPIYSPPRGKLKGWMRNHKGQVIKK